MIVTERTQIPDAALPVDAFKAHLRLGRGFAANSLQDALLIGFLRASLAAIEAKISKVLLQRDFSITLSAWRDGAREPLPLTPVTEITALTLIDDEGRETTATRFHLQQDAQKPMLIAHGACLPSVPRNGLVRIDLSAGLAAEFDALPGDLSQAVLQLAAYFYEHRDASFHPRFPYGVEALIARHRVLRLGAQT
ncbi:hypothetical protein GG681_03325 [Epibacterium sp. SM1969]|uniref:Phage gp6-like head-tail connector protein n=1 Tax=Tritonibacter aquimaris TaxID=2663379 RepID=A0A844ARC7_9RHOB|nr:hypothetical protein [Tritonibacter aquimaris]MQY41658.1 hypothetical protein [Tritonibacter aquimaris]